MRSFLLGFFVLIMEFSGFTGSSSTQILSEPTILCYQPWKKVEQMSTGDESINEFVPDIHPGHKEGIDKPSIYGPSKAFS